MRMRTVAVWLSLLLLSPLALSAEEGPPRRVGTEVTVYKSPGCECCIAWADYLRDNGFRVTVVDRPDLTDVKAQHGIGPELQSCHTATVGGYAVEGHVPADDIWRLLHEKPPATGLSAPGMPMLSPGMRSIEPRDYDVLLFGPGGVTVFSRY